MRYYTIVITPQNGNPITYTTLGNGGMTNGAALKVDIDIFQNWYHQPAQNGYVRVYGVDFATLRQSANLNPIGANYCSIKIYVGMAKGLPYANPNQAGMIIDGSILQAFGNWQGNQTSLDLIVIPSAYIQNTEINLDFYWKKDQTLQDAVTNTLNIAYNNPPITGSFSPTLKYTELQWGQYLNLAALSKQVNIYSKQINPSKSYKGASITATPKGFYLWDGTDNGQVTNVDFQDIVGNITWINSTTIQAKLVMRADLEIGNLISFPTGIPFINTAGSYSQVRSTISFNGQFTISSIRHVGSSRQPDGNSWVTIVEAVIIGAPT
jgi:hypothetical protein